MITSGPTLTSSKPRFWREYTRVLDDRDPLEAVLPERVRIMTMHGAKGLSGTIVFIPGLEDTILPGTKRVPYPGLVLEAARLLYVSITRARAACIMSNAYRRFFNGRNVAQAPSRFTASLGGTFQQRACGSGTGNSGRGSDGRANLIAISDYRCLGAVGALRIPAALGTLTVKRG